MAKRHLQHIKSSQANKAPQASDLLYGEIAVNYAEGTEALYIKNSENKIVKFVNAKQLEDTEFVISQSLNDLDRRIRESAKAYEEDEEVIAQSLSDLDSRIKDNVNSINSIETEIDGISEREDAIEAAIDENERVTAMALTDIDERLTNETSAREQLTQDVIDNEQAIAGAMALFNEKIDTLSQTVSDNDEIVSGALVDINQRISDVNQVIEDNELVTAKALTELSEAIDNENGVIETLQDDLNSANQRITELNNTVNTLNNNISGLRSVIINMKANGHEWVDLGLPSGTIWATMNIGASSENDGGLYFQWGDVTGCEPENVGDGAGQKEFTGNDYRFYSYSSGDSTNYYYTKYNVTDAKTTLDLEDDAAHTIMGGEWQMPTLVQLVELYNNEYVEVTDNSADGYMTIRSLANGNVLIMPLVSAVSSGEPGTIKGLWTNEKVEPEPDSSIPMTVTNATIFDTENGFGSATDRYCGLPVRGVINGL